MAKGTGQKKNKEIEELTSKVLFLENKISDMNGTNSNIEKIQEKIEAHEKKFEKLFEVLDEGFDFSRKKLKYLERTWTIWLLN